jgi:hypothetical protein
MITFNASLLPAKDLEIVLYKDFLQKLMNKVFPIDLSESNTSGFAASVNIPLGYKLEAENPVLTIQKKYIQVDADVNFSSFLGNQTFPARCKFVPVFDPAKNKILFKVIEGKVNLELSASGKTIDLGKVDLSSYISSIQIPLEINTINIKGKTVKLKCKNAVFQLCQDKIILNGEMYV